jgi:hypothetical protein
MAIIININIIMVMITAQEVHSCWRIGFSKLNTESHRCICGWQVDTSTGAHFDGILISFHWAFPGSRSVASRSFEPQGCRPQLWSWATIPPSVCGKSMKERYISTYIYMYVYMYMYMYIVYCILYIVYCTLYIVYCILYMHMYMYMYMYVYWYRIYPWYLDTLIPTTSHTQSTRLLRKSARLPLLLGPCNWGHQWWLV